MILRVNIFIKLYIVLLPFVNVVIPLSCISETEADLFLHKRLLNIKYQIADSSGRSFVFINKIVGDPFMESIIDAFKKKSIKEGDLLFVESPSNEKQALSEQNDMLRAYTKAGIDGIILVPVSKEGLLESIKQVQEASIPIVLLYNKIDVVKASSIGLKPVPLVTIDNYKSAYESICYAAKKTRNQTGVLIISGSLMSDAAILRLNAAKNAVNDSENLFLINISNGDWSAQSAFDIISKFPHLNRTGLVICGNDTMAFGVMEYLELKKMSEQVKVVGFDAVPKALESIKNGQMIATVRQPQALLAEKTYEVLYKIISKKVPNSVNNVRGEIITAESLSQRVGM